MLHLVAAKDAEAGDVADSRHHALAAAEELIRRYGVVLKPNKARKKQQH